MRASKHKRKRERQRRRYAQRPKPMDKPITRIKTSDLIADISRPLHSVALAEAIKEQI